MGRNVYLIMTAVLIIASLECAKLVMMDELMEEEVAPLIVIVFQITVLVELVRMELVVLQLVNVNLIVNAALETVLMDNADKAVLLKMITARWI